LIQRADAIIVGTIVKMGIAAKPPAGQCAVLLRVELLVENELEGRTSEDTLAYYYFGPFCGITGPVEVPHLGSRGIFFLNTEKGHWRAVADYWQNTLPVASGRHPREFTAGKPIEQAIAEILLVPGDRYAAAGFASNLQTQAAPTARTLLGTAGTDRLMRLLLNHPDMSVRAVACLVLKQDQAADACAGPVLTWYLDRFARGDFTGISEDLVWRLEFLKAYAEPAVRKRAEYLLYQAKTAITFPIPEVTLPDVLIR
jgi:hypothetical protein